MKTVDEKVVNTILQEFSEGFITNKDVIVALNTHLSEIEDDGNINKYYHVPKISFNAGSTRFAIGRFIIVLNFDENDEFKMIYIYENTECIAAFNSFKQGFMHVFSLLLDE